MALLYTSLLAVIVFSFLLVEGKDNSFLAINRSYNSAFDLLFRFYTYLGDGLIWIPLFIYALVYKKRFWIAIIASIIICTLLTQLFKRVVFPHEYRPMIILGEKIRMVQGVEMMRNNSFPSGHTSTAFTLALLLAFMIPGYFWVFFFPTVAFLLATPEFI